MDEYELKMLSTLAPSPESVGPCLVAYVAAEEKKASMELLSMSTKDKNLLATMMARTEITV